MKDVILVIALLMAVGLSVVVVRFNEKATKAGKSLQEERYSRMVAEESLQKNAAKVATLESQLKTAQDKMGKIEDILEQEKGVNSDLKSQYERLAQSKSELEGKLKATLEEKSTAQAQAAQSADAPADDQHASEQPAGVQ